MTATVDRPRRHWVRFEWTPERDARLRLLVGEKRPWSEIGADIGCGSDSARHRSLRLGIYASRVKYRRWTDEESTVLAKFDGLLNRIEIAGILGRTPHSVRGHADKNGFKANQNRLRVMADLERQVKERDATIADLQSRLAAVGEVPPDAVRGLRIMLAAERGYHSKGRAAALLGMSSEQLEAAMRREAAAGVMEGRA